MTDNTENKKLAIEELVPGHWYKYSESKKDFFYFKFRSSSKFCGSSVSFDALVAAEHAGYVSPLERDWFKYPYKSHKITEANLEEVSKMALKALELPVPAK